MLSNNPLNPPGVGGSIFLGESQSRIYRHMRAKFGRGPTVVSKKGGGGTDTNYDTFHKYVRCNTANNVSNCGGDPATQSIVKDYQIIKL